MTAKANIEKTLEKIRQNSYSRAELTRIRANAEAKLKAGNQDAELIIGAINQAKPTDDFIVFMGFCLGGSLENRLDTEWKEKDICTFHYLESQHQLDDFNSILVGDLIVLKKRQQFGKTMQLHGHGRVTGVQYNAAGERYLQMSWSDQSDIIEVPLMGCNATVDIRTMDKVEAEMPEAFWSWLGRA